MLVLRASRISLLLSQLSRPQKPAMTDTAIQQALLRKTHCTLPPHEDTLAVAEEKAKPSPLAGARFRLVQFAPVHSLRHLHTPSAVHRPPYPQLAAGWEGSHAAAAIVTVAARSVMMVMRDMMVFIII